MSIEQACYDKYKDTSNKLTYLHHEFCFLPKYPSVSFLFQYDACSFYPFLLGMCLTIGRPPVTSRLFLASSCCCLFLCTTLNVSWLSCLDFSIDSTLPGSTICDALYFLPFDYRKKVSNLFIVFHFSCTSYPMTIINDVMLSISLPNRIKSHQID